MEQVQINNFFIGEQVKIKEDALFLYAFPCEGMLEISDIKDGKIIVSTVQTPNMNTTFEVLPNTLVKFQL